MAMQERDVERMISNVAIELGAGVSETGMRAALFDVIKEFFDLSNAWFEWITLPVGPQAVTYAIYPKQGGMITRLWTAFDQNQVHIPAGISFGVPPGTSVAGLVPNQYVSPPGAIFSIIYPQSSNITAQILVVKNIIAPTLQGGIPDAPDWLLPLYETYIKDGLIGIMAAQPAKPYTDMGVAKYHLARFRDGAAMAKTAVIRANSYGGQAWRYPRQGIRGSQRGGVSTAYPSQWGT